MSAQTHASHDAHDTDDGQVHAHVAPVSFYAKVFGTLIGLTVVTVSAANIDLGPANLPIAILIATIKASLVVTFFMHLKDDRRFNALVFLSALLFGAIFLTYTLNDTAHRGAVDGLNGLPQDPRNGEWAAGTSEGKKERVVIPDDVLKHAAESEH